MKPGKPLERHTPLRARTPMSRSWWARKREPSDPALPKHGPSLRRESPQRAREMGIYRHRRLLFLAAHNYVCESPWPCGQRATTIQHRMGRDGWRLLAEQWWAASCWHCNVDTESDGQMAAEARATHWKVSPDFAGSPDERPILPLGERVQ